MRKTAKLLLADASLAVVLFSLAFFVLTPFSVLAAGETIELDISGGNITITSTGYRIGGSAEVSHTGEYIITGSTTENKVIVQSGSHTITIRNLNIDFADKGYSQNYRPVDFENADACILIIEGSNTLKGGGDCPAINVPNGKKLAIEGTGTLYAYGGDAWPAIGRLSGNGNVGTGYIEINSGTIFAYGGANAAGIGSSATYPNGTVIINGGTITAIGGENGAGIGGGKGNSWHPNGGSGGIIKINGGTVIAQGGVNSAGIGGGIGGEGGDITISGGTVTATGGENGAGIGGGSRGKGGNITISGGTVSAAGGANGAGIGGGSYGNSGDITVSGGKVTVTGGEGGSDIGGGNGGSSNGNIEIDDGIVNNENNVDSGSKDSTEKEEHVDGEGGNGNTLTIPTTSSVKGLESTVYGAFLIEKVNGIAFITPLADIVAGYGLASSERVYAKVWDLDPRKSYLAQQVIDSTAAALGAETGPALNIELGKMDAAGKFSLLSQDSFAVTIKVGVPASFVEKGKTWAVVRVRPGGAISVLADLDTDDDTVTFTTTGGAGAYAIVKY